MKININKLDYTDYGEVKLPKRKQKKKVPKHKDPKSSLKGEQLYIYIISKQIGENMSQSKTEKIGKYVRGVGYLSIRQKITPQRRKKNHLGVFETIGGSIEINLFHGKHKIGGPYNSHTEAELKGIELLGKKFKYTKPKK